MKKSLRCFVVLLGTTFTLSVYVALAPGAYAQPAVVPYFSIHSDSGTYGGYQATADDFQLGADGKTWEMIGSRYYALGSVAHVWIEEMKFDTDPLIYGNYLVQNNTLVNQIYTVGFSIPTTWAAPNLIRGSIDTSVIGTSATISTVAPTAIYQAQIDGVTVETLQDHLFTLSTPQSAVSQGASFGFQLNNIAVTSNIGILLRFELTPGDTAAIISDFEIIAVPEPGTLVLLLLGGGILALRRQRR